MEQFKEDLRVPDTKEGEKEDLNYLRQTLKGEDLQAEFLGLGLAEKGEGVMEEQEKFCSAHQMAINQHVKLINREHEMLKKAQELNEDDDIADYVDDLELILKRRRELDDILLGQLGIFKRKLKEEEEEHCRMTQGLQKMPN